MAIDSASIARRRFRRRWFGGYHEGEVTSFLRAVAADHRELVIRLDQLERTVALALRSPTLPARTAPTTPARTAPTLPVVPTGPPTVGPALMAKQAARWPGGQDSPPS